MYILLQKIIYISFATSSTIHIFLSRSISFFQRNENGRLSVLSLLKRLQIYLNFFSILRFFYARNMVTSYTGNLRISILSPNLRLSQNDPRVSQGPAQIKESKRGKWILLAEKDMLILSHSGINTSSIAWHMEARGSYSHSHTCLQGALAVVRAPTAFAVVVEALWSGHWERTVSPPPR